MGAGCAGLMEHIWRKLVLARDWEFSVAGKTASLIHFKKKCGHCWILLIQQDSQVWNLVVSTPLCGFAAFLCQTAVKSSGNVAVHLPYLSAAKERGFVALCPQQWKHGTHKTSLMANPEKHMQFPREWCTFSGSLNVLTEHCPRHQASAVHSIVWTQKSKIHQPVGEYLQNIVIYFWRIRFDHWEGLMGRFTKISLKDKTGKCSLWGCCLSYSRTPGEILTLQHIIIFLILHIYLTVHWYTITFSFPLSST